MIVQRRRSATHLEEPLSVTSTPLDGTLYQQEVLLVACSSRRVRYTVPEHDCRRLSAIDPSVRSIMSAVDVPSNDIRFQMELEFIQCLASPAYLNCTCVFARGYVQK